MSNNIKDIFQFDPEYEKNILWQYDNADVIKSLIEAKKSWYEENTKNFWDKIRTDFLNIDSATDWGLNLWGKILKAKRVYNVNGTYISISTELYRRYIKGKLQVLFSAGTIPDILKYCNSVFADYSYDGHNAVNVKDNHDMSITYILNFNPTTEELALIYSRDFFPTPAGVDYNILITPNRYIFGFYGSDFQPFNQAPFWDGRFIR